MVASGKALWRCPDNEGRPKNPVIPLTANELFSDFSISVTSKELGEPHKSYAGCEHTDDFRRLADATQRIDLGLPSVHESFADQSEMRMARKKRLKK
jgi:hypothetical protein